MYVVCSCGSNQKNENEPVILEPEVSASSKITRAQLVMNALFVGYPNDIHAVEFRDGDWAILMHDVWYYYCNGRILPEDLREDISKYRPLILYNYPVELSPFVTQPVPESRTDNNINNASQQRSSLLRSPFMDDLWLSRNRNEAYSNLKRIRFLERTVRVHYKIVSVLEVVEERILEEAEKDSSIKTWINSLAPLQSWNWRSIAATELHSFHSYGAAIDLIPRTIGRKQTYWLWTSKHRRDWFNVPYEERYHPPEKVIKIFENHGFIWGGKWQRFDTMHFEYRPEVLILNGMSPNIVVE